uniref:deoxyribose-phosphate aldolase n=1 Tax=Elaeophora elaphi TaxID=1147741 RepID=A0A0R3RGC0_9BILA
MGKDFNAEKFHNVTQNMNFINESMITKMTDTVKQRAQSMIDVVKYYQRHMLGCCFYFQDDQLLKLISFIDLTTLNSDDTNDLVERLIDKAVLPYPMRPEAECAAVCVYPAKITGAKHYLHSKYDQQQSLAICSVAGGFPSGQYRIESKILEVKLAVEDGANEIDIVISRDAALEQDWKRVYDEVAALKTYCGSNCMKTILATGELQSNANIYRASWAAMLAGIPFAASNIYIYIYIYIY